ncbi:MAG: hypothetical protein ACHQ4H_17855, partial [Ktedonobacterales bacterium]
MANETVPCAESVSSETLSALRDELLPTMRATQLRVHASACAACRERLTAMDGVRAALLRQR